MDVIKTKSKEEICKVYYENLDMHLNEIFLNRAMQLHLFPEDKDEIDKYIADKSKELMDKYDSMSGRDLFLHSIIDMANNGVPVDVIGDLVTK